LPTLLLALHLWHAPLAPSSAAQLHLLPSIALHAEPEAALAAPPVPGRTPPTTAQYTFMEMGGGLAAFLASQAAVAGIETGLVLGVNAIGASNALGTLMIIAGLAIGVVDLAGYPLLITAGAQAVGDQLGFANLSFRAGALGSYLGVLTGSLLLVTAIIIEAAAIPSANQTSGTFAGISPLAWSGILGALIIPVAGGIGASIGLHWHDDDTPSEPADPPSSPPTLMLPPALPPPQASLPPVHGAVLSIPLLSVPFG
jgi:hypothetical protein